jgi:hypothetical protein
MHGCMDYWMIPITHSMEWKHRIGIVDLGVEVSPK